MSDQQAQVAVAAVESVEALPTVVERALRAMYDSRSGAHELADIVGLDLALTGRLLRLVNSPYYRTLPRPVVSLTEAILRLGYRAVQSALLTTATTNLLRSALLQYGLLRNQFWQHSIAVAFGAREIARRSRRGRGEEAYVVGLLHDIGKVGLSRQNVISFSEIQRRVREQGMTYHEAEMAELGFDHARVGELVTIRWGLPRSTTVAVGAHHRPCTAPGALAATVATADAMAWSMGFPGTGDQVPRQIDSTILARLGLTAAEVDRLAASLTSVVRDALGFLSTESGLQTASGGKLA